ncbi:hypothetical protein BBR01nite_45580 [Brevibacillus brevis]|nr:hypothetical protein BBR01nite_45580 [Brevibacillus brevis]
MEGKGCHDKVEEAACLGRIDLSHQLEWLWCVRLSVVKRNGQQNVPPCPHAEIYRDACSD